MVAPLTKALASIEDVRAPARADPASLSKALAYWDALRSVNGEDFRSGVRLLDALRTVACTNPEALTNLPVPILNLPIYLAMCPNWMSHYVWH